MANDEKELFKFVNDSKYRDKIISKIHKDADNLYNKKIKQIENERNKLYKERMAEINRISAARWESISGGKLLINRTEGKIKINNVENSFSSIQGAEINIITGMRVVTTENAKTKSKKHSSLGGAVVGGMIAGPVGAVVGGVGLGKTTGKTTGKTVSNQIPTCIHLGVLVNIDGYINEIVLIRSQVDQSSFSFNNAQNDAHTIVSTLEVLAKTPVPQSFLKPEDESSVRNIEQKMGVKQLELEDAIANRPTYALPSVYRTEEQSDMSDEEYLQYLRDMDAQRIEQQELQKAASKKQQEELKAIAKQKREEERIERKNQQEIIKAIAKKEKEEKKLASKQKRQENQKLQNKTNGVHIIYKILDIIYSVIFWILSIFILTGFIAVFSIEGGTLSGIIFLTTAILINPVTGYLIRKHLFALPKWVAFMIFFIGFVLAINSYPSSNNSTDTNVSITQNLYII